MTRCDVLPTGSLVLKRMDEAIAFPASPLATLARTILAGALYAAIACPLAKMKTQSGPFLEGAFTWNQNGLTPRKLYTGVVRTFLFPAAAEELIWRGALLPRPGELGQDRTCGMVQILIFSLFFMGYHIWPMPNILDKLPGPARQAGAFSVFRDWKFLLQVAIMNVAMVAAYYWDGGIWPGVVLHWLAVVIMQWGYGFDKKLAPQLDWPAGDRTDSAAEPFLSSTL